MELKTGYKQTEVGIIPEDWEVRNLDKEIDLLTGFPFSSSLYTTSGIRLLRGSNIKRGVTDWSEDITKYWEGLTPELKAYVLNEGDIVIAMDGSLVGRSFARLSEKDLPALLLQRVARIRSNKIDMGYLKEFVCSDYFTKYCDSVKTITAIPHISPGDIKRFTIPTPPTKAEQQAIAEALSDADALIGTLEKLIAKKWNIKQGTMQQLLAGKKRLPGFSGKWETKPIGQLGKPYGGLSGKSKNDFENGTHPYIPFLNIINNPVIDTTYFDYVDIGISENQNTAMKGDLFFNGSSETPEDVGMCSVLLEDIPNLYLNSFCFGFRLNKELKTNGLYLSYFFRSNEGRKLFYTLAQGATRYNLSKHNFMKMEISYPKPEEQTAIAQVLTDMDAEIKALEQKRDKYKMIKQGMMQELLTGQIRLIQKKAIGTPMSTMTKLPETTDILPKSGHNWQINEAVVIAVLTSTFGSEQYPLGRKRYTKFSYLLHRRVEGKAKGYRKKAAGPYNPDTRYKGPEKIAQNNRYIKSHTTGEFSGFVIDESIERARKYFDKWYGGEVLQWLEQFRYESNEQLELLATVDMAICELANNKQTISVKGIKNVIRSHPEWKAKLNRPIFSDENITAAIEKSQELFEV